MDFRNKCGPNRPAFRKLSVLMPVYNEIRTLRTIVHRVLNAPVDIAIELVIVDDGSTDGSRELIAQLAQDEPRIKHVFHEKNQGKGGAVRTAIKAMTGDLALIQDADLEYNPADYPALLRPMLEGVADAVFGSRFLAGGYRRVLYYWHTLGNQLLTLVCNVLNDINLTDMETGYKLIRADILRAIPLTANGFALEPELTTKLAKWDLRLYEVPISYQGRTYAEGKKIGLKDMFAALWALFKYRFFSCRFSTHEGFLILQSVRRARGFNRWLFRRLAPYVGQHVLEAGSGIGNLTEFVLDRKRLACVDIDPFYAERLTQRYGHLSNLSVHELDVSHIEQCSALRKAQLDTILCINVLEHIEDDAATLRNFFHLLRPGGHAVLLVPAEPRLYTPVDKALGHFRRYTREEMMTKMRQAGFEVVESRGFNRLGTLGWYVSGKILGRTTLSAGQMKLYDWLLPIAKLMERLPLWPHLSVIAVGRKPTAVELPGIEEDLKEPARSSMPRELVFQG
ncbi:MAG TPA: bifunctional glycosyltransferase/class I SAM-dependent methyltransferase [Pirellulales bacterium]|nr:bifunctional glycosyltransferase/class I SAM-dependent methyltransferase [Pirellulales bacterium]